MTAPPEKEIVLTKDEVNQLRMAGREIGSNELALALYARLEQEIALCELKIRQIPGRDKVNGLTDSETMIHYQGRINAIMFCLEVLGELNDVHAPKTKETDKK
jgi:hypothetical protein